MAPTGMKGLFLFFFLAERSASDSWLTLLQVCVCVFNIIANNNHNDKASQNLKLRRRF